MRGEYENPDCQVLVIVFYDKKDQNAKINKVFDFMLTLTHKSKYYYWHIQRQAYSDEVFVRIKFSPCDREKSPR